jgi:hypothetical protein
VLESEDRGRGLAEAPTTSGDFYFILFYYESRKRELKTRLIYEDRCDERLKN